jgi:hypothetical protein
MDPLMRAIMTGRVGVDRGPDLQQLLVGIANPNDRRALAARLAEILSSAPGETKQPRLRMAAKVMGHKATEG